MSFSRGDSSQNTVSEFTSVASRPHSSESSPSDSTQVASEAENLTHHLQMHRGQLDFNSAVYSCAMVCLLFVFDCALFSKRESILQRFDVNLCLFSHFVLFKICQDQVISETL